jgi:hypothetical protein
LVNAAAPLTRRARLFRLGRRLMPWVSLAMGVGSALLMDRRPSRAGLIAGASVVGWGLLVALLLLHRIEVARLPQRRQLLLKVAKVGAVAASEWLIQLSLFFVAPFYFVASAWHPGHLVFLAVLALAGALTLWDPLLQVILKRPLTGLALQAIASFCALNAVLPILGLSNRVALWAAALATALSLPLVAAAVAQERRLRAALQAAAMGVLVPLALLAGAQRAIPAAPLRLVSMEMGTTLEGYQVSAPVHELAEAPAQLVCVTGVWAPRGLRDELFHVWARDGQVTDRVALAVEGGRANGYHTYSIKKHLEPSRGLWTCTVQTGSGQVLGEQAVAVR